MHKFYYFFQREVKCGYELTIPLSLHICKAPFSTHFAVSARFLPPYLANFFYLAIFAHCFTIPYHNFKTFSVKLKKMKNYKI